MRLIDDWKHVLKRAWSIRLLILAGILSGLEIAFTVFVNNPPIPPGIFAVLSGLTTAAAFVARIIAQKDVSQ